MQAIEGPEPPSSALDLIADAAREAGAIAMRYFRKTPEVWWKDGSSPVSEADLAVDTYLRNTLLAVRPDHGWLSEETADDPERLSAARTFVVDPIDGTRAFIEGRTTWCVSIAVVEAGRTIAGVLECPAKNETYSAAAGDGARLGPAPIRVREAGNEVVVAGPKRMVAALPRTARRSVRHRAYVPSLAYRLALVARGDIDATFVKPNSHDWDLAAADLILREAGGAVRDRNGGAPFYAGPDVRRGSLVAGSGALLDTMAAAIAELDD